VPIHPGPEIKIQFGVSTNKGYCKFFFWPFSGCFISFFFGRFSMIFACGNWSGPEVTFYTLFRWRPNLVDFFFQIYYEKNTADTYKDKLS
jgi:hypothetical protein